MTDKTLKLLFVDDDPDIRNVTNLALGLDSGIEVRTAEGGREALDMLRDRSWRPDCVLLDVEMPDIGGDKVLTQIRAVPRAKDLPVILLTGNVSAGDIARYLMLGAVGVISKPFNPLTLAGEVRTMLTQAVMERTGRF